jgi:predicted glycosyltransferase
MKNIILIDLTQFNYEKLHEVAKLYGIKVECLVNNKKEGFTKLWIDTESGMIVAYSVKKFKDNIFVSDEFNASLAKVKPVEIVKQPKVMDLDSILDKVTKYGVESLNESEKRFLETQ